jgi:hypothetical protein
MQCTTGVLEGPSICHPLALTTPAPSCLHRPFLALMTTSSRALWYPGKNMYRVGWFTCPWMHLHMTLYSVIVVFWSRRSCCMMAIRDPAEERSKCRLTLPPLEESVEPASPHQGCTMVSVWLNRRPPRAATSLRLWDPYPPPWMPPHSPPA